MLERPPLAPSHHLPRKEATGYKLLWETIERKKPRVGRGLGERTGMEKRATCVHPHGFVNAKFKERFPEK